MTPAIIAAELANIPFTLHEYENRPGAKSFAQEAAAALGIDPRRVFKTLIARLDGSDLVMVLVPADKQLDLKLLAAAAGAKRGELAEPAAAERATGYVVGGISPLGTRKVLPTLVDASAVDFPTIYISAGRRGLQLELPPRDLICFTHATTAAVAGR